jgi:hypothetical protein
MVVHSEIEQQSEEWFKIKYGKIGGTRAKGLYVDSDTLMLDILSEKTEEFFFDEDELITTSAMEWGNETEPIARRELERYLGVKYELAGWIQSSFNLLGISPDGITADEKRQCEIKCPQRKKHLENCLNPGIDTDYIAQCIHAFTVNPKLEVLDFLSFRPQNLYKHMSYRKLTRNSKVAVSGKLTVKGTVYEDRGKGYKDYVTTEVMVKSVAEWVEYSQEAAFQIETKCNNEIKKLQF